MQTGKNVLITSVSRKVPLIEAVRQAMAKAEFDGKLYGGDSNPISIGKYFVDCFWRMPETKDEQFRKILAFCMKNDIGYVIPTRDGELAFWAAHKAQLKRFGISVMVSDPKAIHMTIDKLLFGTWGKRHTFPVITTASSIEDIQARRYVVKERFGAGSKKIGINLTKAGALAHAKTLKHPIFQPFVPGQEYSIDLYATRRGRIQGVVVRERNVVVDGESQVTTIIENKRLGRACAEMATALGLYGHAVFQAIVDRRGAPRIIECNSRFGGASTASVAYGLDSFYWFLLESIREPLQKFPYRSKGVPLTMVRYKKDMFL